MSVRFIDISKDLVTTEPYPGDPVPELEIFSSFSSGDSCNMARLTTTLHAGTHADAPLHFIDGGMDISRVPLSPFIGECVVIEVPEGAITGSYVDEHFPKTAERILIKGGGKAYFEKSGAEEAAISLGVKLIGTDANSVGCHHDQTGPHRALLGENVAVLENLDLSEVEPGRYILLAQPVKIAGVEAAPVRAVLVSGYIFWNGDNQL